MKLCIIKLGAMGDVIRTTPVLQVLKQKHQEAEITWITAPECKEILENNPNIKQILTIPVEQEISDFDILYNFDIEQQATNLALKIKATKKLGFYNNEGFPACFNLGAEYYLNTVFDDELKKSNTKTYQQMMFDLAELKYNQEKCQLFLTEKDNQYAQEFVNQNNINTQNLIGIHIGSSPRWPSKAWHLEKVKQFIIKAKQQGNNILLFGGPNEKKKLPKLIEELKQQNITVYQNNPDNTFKQFASLVNLCNHIISGDTLALHTALALNKSTTALFFCNSPYEIEGYGTLSKLISPLLPQFFPEKSDQYDESLVSSISVEQVLETVSNIKGNNAS